MLNYPGALFYIVIAVIGILGVIGLIKGISAKKIWLIGICLSGIGVLMMVFLLELGTKYYGGFLPNSLPFIVAVLFFLGVSMVSFWGLVMSIRQKRGRTEIILCIISLSLAIMIGFLSVLISIATTV